MRALLGMVVLSLVGCDALWGTYVGMGDFGTGDDMGCVAPIGCSPGMPDLATADLAVPPDLAGGCTNSSMCPDEKRFCDLNNNKCTSIPLSTEAFPGGLTTGYEYSIDLPKRYTLMAVGDFNGDQITDVAVSGLFSGAGGSVNANNAANADVEIFRGTGDGSLVSAGSCAVGEKVVYLLPVPANGRDELLVATMGTKIYHCTGSNNSWSPGTPTTLMGLFNTSPSSGMGFKQLALIRQGRTYPDLLVRNSDKLFGTGTPISGSLDLFTLGANYTPTMMTSQPSSSNISWVTATPYHFGTATDTMAISWDSQQAVNFLYVDSGLKVRDQGFAMSPMQSLGTSSELSPAILRTTALLHVSATAPPLLLNSISSNMNYLNVQSGTTAMGFRAIVETKPTNLSGVLLTFADDANGDNKDEIGLYTLTNSGQRHLQLFTYTVSPPAFNTGNMLLDLSFDNENVRGMALGYMEGPSAPRSLAKRKDMIALVENPTAGSRLIIRRGNLNSTNTF